MTKTTEHEVKEQFYRDAMCRAESCLRAMGADAGDHEPGTWDAVMAMLDDVESRGDSRDKAAAALAAAKWVWGFMEKAAADHVAHVAAMVERETAPTAPAAPAA